MTGSTTLTLMAHSAAGTSATAGQITATQMRCGNCSNAPGSIPNVYAEP